MLAVEKLRDVCERPSFVVTAAVSVYGRERKEHRDSLMAEEECVKLHNPTYRLHTYTVT